MAAVVGAGGDFVDEETAVARQKELHAQHAHHVQRLQYHSRHFYRVLGNFGRYVRRSGGNVQNMVGVVVGNHAKMGKAAIRAARGHHRHLALKVHEGFEDGGLVADGVPVAIDD